MSELGENLLPNSTIKTQFQQQSEQMTQLIEQLKVINDNLQTAQISDQQNSKILLAKQTFKTKADVIKQIALSLEKSAQGNEKKNVLNKLKAAYLKEIERQKRILKSIINSTFEKRFSRISIIRQSKAYGQETQTEQLEYFVDQNYVRIVSKNDRNSEKKEQKNYSQVNLGDGQQIKTISIDQDFIEADMIDLENILIDERQKEIDQIEREAYFLNLITNQMGSTLDQQNLQLDFAQQNQSTVKSNIKVTTKELVLADIQQKRLFNKKYYIVIGILIIAIIVLIILLLVIK
ncbi:unnamed protein product [Paramecium sonneborni]|uniref:t-SNARE coiled-coil homology domain-containing protein n=1 Tax=Paramecium sonneborni TaxID=65129 RepID=A0A8S1LW74_9CILI|nr:unnamed protein product [Paramecium sonneborni]